MTAHLAAGHSAPIGEQQGAVMPVAGEEQSELERLRAEVATLRAQLQRPGGDAERRQRWRTIVAALLLVLACVLAPLGVVAVWARNQVSDTDRYVATVAPLASDPAIQQAIAAASLALVFWSRPTGKVVIGLALALLVALAIVEFLGRPPERAAEVSTTHL